MKLRYYGLIAGALVPVFLAVAILHLSRVDACNAVVILVGVLYTLVSISDHMIAQFISPDFPYAWALAIKSLLGGGLGYLIGFSVEKGRRSPSLSGADKNSKCVRRRKPERIVLICAIFLMLIYVILTSLVFF